MLKASVRTLDKAWKLSYFLNEFFQDMFTFVRYNGYSPIENKNKKLFYKILIETHTIEKGLSLKEPKPLFGQAKITHIISMINNYNISYAALPVEMAVGAFQAYLNLHKNLNISNDFLSKLDTFTEQMLTQGVGASGGIKQADFMLDTAKTLYAKSFLQSRSSCRIFKPGNVSSEIIASIVKLAQSAPSQCNRQSTKVHFYQSKDKIKELLILQGGSRGFYDSVDNLFIVTSEVTAWGGAGQRNQPYVDGALFSMSLLLACHANGLGACPLNLALLNTVEKQICRLGDIPSRERLVMMIAIGHPGDEHFRAAKSPRRNTSEVLEFHGS